MSKQKYPQKETSETTGKPKTHLSSRDRYSSVKLHAKWDRKRDEAFLRNEKYERMSLSEQLKSCVPGGSKRQRTRIEAAMAKATPPAVKIAPQTDAQRSAKIVTLVKNAVENDPTTKGKVKRASKKKVAAK